MEDPTVLVAQMLRAPNSSSAYANANILLRKFHRGLPLTFLLPLITSNDANVADLGVWIASELGSHGRTLLRFVKKWLELPSKKSRFYALDCILQWAGPEDGELIVAAAELLTDPEAAVRWKAADVLSRATEAQLRSASGVQDRGSPTHRLLNWLLTPGAKDSVLVSESLESDDIATRRFAAIAAARIASIDAEPLKKAMISADPDIKSIAEAKLGALR
jgi:hypothetical protein